MNVLSNYAFGGDSGGFLLRRSQSLFTENDDSLFHISLCFDKGVLAVHHSSAGLFPEFFHMFRANFHNFPLSLSDRKIAADSWDVLALQEFGVRPRNPRLFLHHCGFVWRLDDFLAAGKACAFGLRAVESRY